MLAGIVILVGNFQLISMLVQINILQGIFFISFINMLVWIIVPGKILKNDKCTKPLDRGRELKELRTWHASQGADRGWSEWGVSSSTI